MFLPYKRHNILCYSYIIANSVTFLFYKGIKIIWFTVDGPNNVLLTLVAIELRIEGNVKDELAHEGKENPFLGSEPTLGFAILNHTNNS